MLNCKICGAAATRVFRCEEHYKCDTCGTKEDLCYGYGGVQCKICNEKRVDENLQTFEGNTTFTAGIVCPHCGYTVEDDLYEYGEGEHDCSDCGNTFDVTRNVEVTYCTEKI